MLTETLSRQRNARYRLRQVNNVKGYVRGYRKCSRAPVNNEVQLASGAADDVDRRDLPGRPGASSGRHNYAPELLRSTRATLTSVIQSHISGVSAVAKDKDDARAEGFKRGLGGRAAAAGLLQGWTDDKAAGLARNEGYVAGGRERTRLAATKKKRKK